MKTERNILAAFILNLSFSVFELVGGIISGSIAIASDAVHDAGDALSIGISYFLEKKSKKQPDEKYTYGYARYSVIGGFITTTVLLISSVIVIYNAIGRIIRPAEIDFNKMIVFAVVGIIVNLCATLFTGKGGSLNQRAVNLHMLEDVLGWSVVLTGAVVMRFTDFTLIDPIMSIGVSAFIFISAVRNLKEIADLFLEKAPHNITPSDIQKCVKKIDGVIDVHHIHIRSLDGQNNLASMHIVYDSDPHKVKEMIRKELLSLGIGHVTIETESSTEHCREEQCHIEAAANTQHAHHHHH